MNFKISTFAIILAGLCACDKTVLVESVSDLYPEEVVTQEAPETPVSLENPENPDLFEFFPISLNASDQGVRDASNNFGFAVFGQLLKLADGNEDVVFSPLSLSLALSMAAEGAAGDTYDQFCKVLGWGEVTREEVGAYYQKMIEGLVNADRQVSFTSSNSLWAANNLDIKETYAEQLSKSFDAESFSVDFALPETLDQINGWCSDKTDGKIQKMLDALDGTTRMMLVNALLFKAPWSLEWNVERDRPFQAGQAVANKDYLHYDGNFHYRAFEGYEVVGVRYGNGRAYEMDIILPEEGKTVPEILGSLNPDALRNLHSTPVELFIPEFSLEYSTGDAFPACLEELGLKLPFSGTQADFSGISSESLYINKVLQKAKIDVSENGTEFAAVTSTLFATSTGPGEKPEKVVFDANRPFAFLIRETSSNSILLMGTLSE